MDASINMNIKDHNNMKQRMTVTCENHEDSQRYGTCSNYTLWMHHERSTLKINIENQQGGITRRTKHDLHPGNATSRQARQRWLTSALGVELALKSIGQSNVRDEYGHLKQSTMVIALSFLSSINYCILMLPG